MKMRFQIEISITKSVEADTLVEANEKAFLLRNKVDMQIEDEDFDTLSYEVCQIGEQE